MAWTEYVISGEAFVLVGTIIRRGENMKKLFGLSVVALAITLISMQEASAWSNIKFGAGFNFQWQTGNNGIGKHFWRSGPLPGQPVYGYGYQNYFPGHGGPGMYGQEGFHAPMPMPAETEAPPAAAYQAGGFDATPVHYYRESYQSGYYTPSYYYGDYGYGQ
jgi:hypothetical protein